MRRVAHPYWDWEDYEAGIFEPSEDTDSHIELAHDLLSDAAELETAMREAVAAFPRSAEHNLTAPAGGRSWLGQAACFHRHGVVEACTRMAWWTLTDTQRDAANEAADRVAAEWKKARRGAETLFG